MKQTKYQRAWYEQNKVKILARSKEWALKNPEKVAAGKRRRYAEKYRYSRFGITAEDYATLFTAQESRCAICRAPEPGTTLGWCIDHDHVTNEVRGILCGPCNTSLGFYEKRIRSNREAFDGYLNDPPMRQKNKVCLTLAVNNKVES